LSRILICKTLSKEWRKRKESHQAATMNKIKEKKNISDFAGKERDRRRRKLVVDQAKTQTNLELKKNEEQMIVKLLEK
jgi:hypothetical protein